MSGDIRPDYYGGADNPYEAIKVIENWRLGFNLGTVVKYVARAGKKDPDKEVEDLRKAAFYLHRQIQSLSVEAVGLNSPEDHITCRVCGFAKHGHWFKPLHPKRIFCCTDVSPPGSEFAPSGEDESLEAFESSQRDGAKPLIELRSGKVDVDARPVDETECRVCGQAYKLHHEVARFDSNKTPWCFAATVHGVEHTRFHRKYQLAEKEIRDGTYAPLTFEKCAVCGQSGVAPLDERECPGLTSGYCRT